MTDTTNPYTATFELYRANGWTPILLPSGRKYPPPASDTAPDGSDIRYTGNHAVEPPEEKYAQWARRGGNIGLRLPRGVCGIDVDDYNAKHGAGAFDALEKSLGKLPKTWTSTSRGADQPARIHLFRIPEGTRLAGGAGADIDVIQFHHRYVVSWPSVHPEGPTYRWYLPDGAPAGAEYPVPSVEHLPALPDAWVAHLAAGASTSTLIAADESAGQRLLDNIRESDADLCETMTDLCQRRFAEWSAIGEGGRHDAMLAAVMSVVMAGAAGHAGSDAALTSMEAAWVEAAGPERESEFERMVLGAARKAVTERETTAPEGTDPWDPATIDPCEAQATLESLYTAPTPVATQAAAAGVAPAAVVVPAIEFAPNVRDDHGLAMAVRDYVSPVLRYARDANVWIERHPVKWEETAMAGGSVVSLAADQLRQGNPEAEKGTPERDAHELYQRFRKNAGASAIGSRLDAIVKRYNPRLDTKLADLDQDPEVLWAGGMPWDLRASGEQPVPAALDPSTPHLMSARVLPALVPTPYWDKYIASVWPDPEIRAWALRVLSISLAGYPDAALPVLYGPERTGKSSVVTLLVSVLGDYGHAADPRLLAGKDNTHASVVYALKGRRLSFIDEGPRRGELAVERLKQLTGGAALTGNAMRANPITFDPTHTLVMTTNDEPHLTDPALRARIRVIPCDADKDAVRHAREALNPAWATEAPGVLAALMSETAQWLANRRSALNEAAPAAVVALGAELEAEQNPVTQWLKDCTEPYVNGTPAKDLYAAFAQWMTDSVTLKRRAIPTVTRWGRELTTAGYAIEKRRDANYRPLRLRTPGWAAPASVPDNTPGVEGSVEGCGGFNPEPSTPEKPGPTSENPETVDSVDSCVSTTTTQKQNTYIHTPLTENGGTNVAKPSTPPHPPQSGAESASDLRVDGLNQPSTDPVSEEENASPQVSGGFEVCEACGQSPGLTKAGRFRVHVTETGGKCSQSGKQSMREARAAAEARALAKQAKIDAASGPLVELPALVNREGIFREGRPLTEVTSVLAEITKRSGFLCIDVETTGFPVGHPAYGLRTVQLGDDELCVVFDRDDPVHMAAARQALADAPELVAFNSTADTVPSALEGLGEFGDLMAKMTDVAIMGKLADPTTTDNEEGLKALAPAVLGKEAVIPAAEKARSALFKAGGWLTNVKPTDAPARSGWAQVDRRCRTMVVYAASDVLDAAALRKRLPMPSAALMERERALAAITGRVSITGIALNAELVETQLGDREPRVAGLTELIHGITLADGGPVISNPESNPQVIQAFTERGVTLPRGKVTATNPKPGPSAAKDALQPLVDAPGVIGPLATAMLAYRKDSTLLKNMVRPWSVQTRQGDGRTYPTIYTLGADTGRMSCVRPNLQQVSREGGLRECLEADPGYMIVAADFSSVEVRVLAALSGDESLKAMIAGAETCDRCLAGKSCTEHDLHAKIAQVAYGDGWTKLNRYNVKRDVFGRLYGGGIDTLAKQTGLSVEMTQKIIDILDALTPGAAAWARQVRAVVKNGHTTFETYSGRTIHLDPELPHKAVNYLVQGTGRELLVDAILKWDKGPFGGGVILPVHDEILAFVREEDAPAAAAYLTECMTTEINGVKIAVEADSPVRCWTSVG